MISVLHRWQLANPYLEDYSIMLATHTNTVANLSPGTLILTRHTSCITTGLVGSYNSSWIRTDRGGGPTYHDHGQIICYPIVKLEQFGINPIEYNSLIYSWIYNSVGGILRKSLRFKDKLEIIENGIYLNSKKIAFIGTRIKQGVSLHGFAINLYANLAGFANFNPCDNQRIIVGNLFEKHHEVVESLLNASPFI